jgi:hypothetical protein
MVESGVKHHKLSEIYQHFLKNNQFKRQIHIKIR